MQQFTFLTLTSKQKKLQSRAKSLIVGNSFAISNLMCFFKIGCHLTGLFPTKVDTFFKRKISLILERDTYDVFDHNFLTNKATEL